MVLHFHVLALDITDFAEAFAKRSGMARNGRSGLDEADDRHRRLLRARGERPSRRTGKRSNEFSSPDADCHVTLPRGSCNGWNQYIIPSRVALRDFKPAYDCKTHSGSRVAGFAVTHNAVFL
jgi:hypothetical protein